MFYFENRSVSWTVTFLTVKVILIPYQFFKDTSQNHFVTLICRKRMVYYENKESQSQKFDF